MSVWRYLILAALLLTASPAWADMDAAWAAGFKSAAGLSGRKIALTSLGGYVHYMLYQVETKYHVDPKSVTLQTFGTDANDIAALKSGVVAGAPQVLITAAVAEDVPAVLAGARYDVMAGRVTRVL